MPNVLESQGPSGPSRYVLGPRAGGIGAIDLVIGERIHPPELRGPVLVKAARRDQPTFAATRERLLDEALENASFAHTNLTAVVDLVEDDTGAYLVLELPIACDLAAVHALLRGRGQALSFELAAFVAMEMLKGIHHLHTARGPAGERLTIVVRELTPAHVLLSATGQVKIVNRGLASALAELKKLPPAEQFAYYSPERIAGEPFSVRSDVYAAGVILFELLRGRACFTGATKDEVLTRIVSSAVPFQELAAIGVPGTLVNIVERATAFLPERRYASAVDALRDLEGWLHRHAPKELPRVLARFLGVNGLVRVSDGASGTRNALVPAGVLPTDDELRGLAGRPEVRAIFGDRSPTSDEWAFVMSVMKDGITEREVQAIRTRAVPPAAPASPGPSSTGAPSAGSPPPSGASAARPPPPGAPQAVRIVLPPEPAAEEEEEERPLTPAEKKKQRRQWLGETAILVIIAIAVLIAALTFAAFDAELAQDPDLLELMNE